jgi:multidrug efflux system outer membrane protein
MTCRLRSLTLGGTAAAVLLTGCAVGPVYHAPREAAVAPSAAVAAVSSAFTATPPPQLWWRSLNDPELTSLIDRALTGNVDVRQAVARLRQSRALFQDAALDRYPRVTASGAYSRSDAQEPGFGDNRVNLESAQLGFDAAWELDIFGRVRHSIASARATSEATAFDLADVRVSVIAEVARNYFILRGAQARRDVALRNVETQRQTLALTRQRVAIGAGDPVDVESARARLAATEATVPDFTAGEAQAAYRLAVLLGVRPGALDAELAASVGGARRRQRFPSAAA